MSVKGQEVVVIIGASGSGKSTLLRGVLTFWKRLRRVKFGLMVKKSTVRIPT